MKKLLFLIIFLASELCSSAQNSLTPDNISLIGDRVSLHGIINVDSASVSTIHDGIIKWISLSYKDPQTVIKSDLQSTIVIEGFIPTTDFEHVARIVFDIKDNRYRWTIDNIRTYSELLSRLGGNLETEIETEPWYKESNGDSLIKEIINRYSYAPIMIIQGINQCIKDTDW